MEKSIYGRYSGSQDHLIISLNEQIEILLPMKDSYASLQHYHIKLTHDFQSLIHEQDYNSHAYMAKIKDILTVNDELDLTKNRLVEDLREMENKKAKMTLERKNLLSACETLASKVNLESQQNLHMQDRTRDLLESIKKTEQNIVVYRRIIEEVEIQVAMKKKQNADIEEDINRRKEKNRTLAQSASNLQCSIKKVTAGNEGVKKDIKTLDLIMSETEGKIREELRKGRGLSEKILSKNEELANICHQKEYYSRLIESEMLIKEDLDISESKLSELISRRTKELARVGQQNAELSNRIQHEQAQMAKNQKYKSALKLHLNELVQTNTQILQALEKCCNEDVQVHQLLNQKAKMLERSCSKVRSGGMKENGKRMAGVLRERSNESLLKTADKSGKSWINQLKDLENMNMRQNMRY